MRRGRGWDTDSPMSGDSVVCSCHVHQETHGGVGERGHRCVVLHTNLGLTQRYVVLIHW